MAPKKPVGAFKRLVDSTGGILFARLSMWAFLPMVGLLYSSMTGGIADAKLAAEGARTAAAAAYSQVTEVAVALATLNATLQGEQRAQAIINGNVDFALMDHEARIRVQEAWRRNVLSLPAVTEFPG